MKTLLCILFCVSQVKFLIRRVVAYHVLFFVGIFYAYYTVFWLYNETIFLTNSSY